MFQNEIFVRMNQMPIRAKLIDLCMRESMVHIKGAHIEGYKSILNADVEFSPGLNIIIGKNGAGKSNLLQVLGALLLDQRNTLGTAKVSSEVFLNENNSGTFSSQFHTGSVHVNSPDNDILFVNSIRTVGDQGSADKIGSQSNGPEFVELVQIPHTIPTDIPFLDTELNSKISPSPAEMDGIWSKMIDPRVPYFSRSSLSAIFIPIILEVAPDWENLESEISGLLKGALGIKDSLINYLRQCTPIDDLRLSQSFSVKNTGKKSCFFSNAAYEFLVGNEWLSFKDLSDGTKRLIFIIFSFCVPRLYFPGNGGVRISKISDPSKLVFLEEPELGIHPHQLHLLLLFLKEQARTQQIIITTHSPQVLDILDKDELDKIIIASYDAEKGSQFTHLSEAKKEKALAYMEDMLLSDYWRFSDLEARPVLS